MAPKTSYTDQPQVNDADFRQAEKDWYSFVAQMTEKLSEIDDTVPELPVKDVVGETTVPKSRNSL